MSDRSIFTKADVSEIPDLVLESGSPTQKNKTDIAMCSVPPKERCQQRTEKMTQRIEFVSLLE